MPYSGELPDGLAVPERFERYLAACNQDRTAASELYVWNAQVTEAFYTPLHAYEVVLRNAIDPKLMDVTGQEDWWNASSVRWRPAQERMISSALTTLQRTKGSGFTHGHMVAELPLGFWTGVVSGRYQRQWQAGVKDAFPNYAGRQGALQGQLDRVRNLRNRIAHHEPIFYRDLTADFRNIKQVLGFIDVKAEQWVTANSRVQVVLDQRPQAGTAPIAGPLAASAHQSADAAFPLSAPQLSPSSVNPATPLPPPSPPNLINRPNGPRL